MIRIIRPAIFKFFLEAAADFNFIFRSYSNISAIQEPVEVATEEQTIIHGVRPSFIIGLDMSGFEGWERMLLGNSASPAIRVGNKNPKRSLAKARSDRSLFSVTSVLFVDAPGF